jgi:hypothetical protein
MVGVAPAVVMMDGQALRYFTGGILLQCTIRLS